MRHLKILVFLLAGTLMLNAQKAETPDFSYELGGKIDAMTLTSSGILLITHNKGLAGIKPGSGELVFNFDDYGKVKQEEIYVVPNTPYVMVGQAGFAGISAKQSVIDVISGKRLFDTKANGWKAASRPTLILPENKLIVSGQRNAKEKYAQAVGIYDMGTGNEVKVFKLKGYDVLTGVPSIVNGGLLVPAGKGLSCIDIETGNERWTTKLKNVAFVEASDDNKSIYAFVNKNNGKNQEIYKIGPSGNLLWSEGKKLKGVVSNFEVTPKGLAIVSDVADSGKSGLAKLAAAKAQSNISFLSTSSGDDLWEKAPKTKGYVQHFYIVDDGIVFGLASGGINKISFDGKPLFKKPLKTGENIHTMALTKHGMIYITDSDANIVNLDTGESIWNKPIKYKRAKSVASTYDKAHSRYLISTGTEILSIDENSGDISNFASYKFEEKEYPNSLRVREGGLLLSSDQNLMMLDFDGKEKFHEYFRSPGKSAVGVILMAATAVASTAVAMDAAARAGANQNAFGQYTSQYGADMDRASKMFSAIATASFAEMAKRFSATSATENSQFILTKLNDGVGLVKVSKDSGTVEKEIVLKNKKPTYEVDELGGYLYYLANNNTVYVYDLKK